MRLLFVGKRHYTRRDALRERYGRIYRFPLHWHRGGHEVSLMLLDYRGTHAETTLVDGFPVTSTPVRHPSCIVDARRKALAFKPDAVIASGDCFVGLAGYWIARRLGKPFIFDVYDDYRAFGGYRFFLGWDAFGFLCRRADAVWFASHRLAEQEGQQFVLPNGVDTDQFAPKDVRDARRNVSLDPDARWIGYFGSREPDRGTDDLVAAVGLLHARDPGIRLVLCGGGRRDIYREPWVDDRGNVRHDATPDFINACDVVVLPYRRGPIIDQASSVKMAEYLFCQRPIVATRTPSLLDNFPLQAAELGAAVAEPGNVPDLARALDAQLGAPRIASVPFDQTWEAIAARALDILASVLK